MARKELFTIIGNIVYSEGRKRFKAKSPDHMQLCINRLTVGDTVALDFSTKKQSRSRAQLAYHFVLLGYLSDHTGYTPEELHDYMMRAVFGEKMVTLGDRTFAVRRSMAAHAAMDKTEAAELIEYDLKLCADMGIRVPTKEELGYLPG